MKCLGYHTDCLLYVDDFSICFRSKSMGTIERQLQQNLHKIDDLGNIQWFEIFKIKNTVCTFLPAAQQHDDPVLYFLWITYFNTWGADRTTLFQALSVTSQDEIRLWHHYIWLCKKIISTNALSTQNQGLR